MSSKGKKLGKKSGRREKRESTKKNLAFCPCPKFRTGCLPETKGSVMLNMRSGPILAVFIPRPWLEIFDWGK